jgi:RNA polymerase primary sigma factor
MLPQYAERLGLTATLERTDDAVTELLIPYFGGICFRYGFEQAIADGVCAAPRVAFVGVDLSLDERAEYTATEQQLVGARNHLRALPGVPVEPFGDFLAAVAHLAERDAGADGRAARQYLDAFSKRREIVAQSSGKYELLGSLAPAIRDAHGALVFTETVRAANHAINRLDPLVSIDLITGTTARRQRREILDDLRVRRLDAVAAPRVLDEGVDVPDANLGIVMSASRTRRQMIQRMGRILRRKAPGVSARFVIMFAKDTLEDPTQRVERDGFLDEIERISDATGVFDGARFGALEAFLAAPGPDVVPEPERYARDDPRLEAEFARTVVSIPAPEADVPEPDAHYLELTMTNLPVIAKPKVVPKRLSTGQAPLEIEQVDAGWRLTCTGCGASSRSVQFRWQVLDETVACRCD